MRRPFLICLALLLTFAQTASAVHGLSHAADARHHSDRPLPHSPVCEQCVVADTLGGALPAVALALGGGGIDAVVVAGNPVSFRSGPITLYASRAPPVLV